MKQITEDYVSYEIAQLLKEKGFDNEGVSESGGFYCDYKYDETDIGIVYESEMLNRDLARNEYLRPTHQMTLKWLREVHNLYIDIRFNRHYQCYIPIVYNMSGTLESIANLEERPKSYEEATEAALLYVLKNLI